MNFSDTSRLFGSGTAPVTGVGSLLQRLNLDGPLLGGLSVISVFGLVVLYSAVAQNFDLWLQQLIRLSAALVAMLIVAQFPPDLMRRWTPWGFLAGLALLILVLVTGEVGQGAQRWLDIGIRFQPSEIMKLAVPMMAAWYLHDRQLPPKFIDLVVIGVLIVVTGISCTIIVKVLLRSIINISAIVSIVCNRITVIVDQKMCLAHFSSQSLLVCMYFV